VQADSSFPALESFFGAGKGGLAAQGECLLKRPRGAIISLFLEGSKMQLDEFALGILDGDHSDEKIEVVLIEEAGRSGVEMRRMIWGKGIGWYPQKRFFIPIDQIATVRHLLHQAEPLSRSRKKTKFTPGDRLRLVPPNRHPDRDSVK
jgi:hypothetical protein